MVYNTLNKLMWTKKLREYSVTIIHRGAHGDKKVIPGDKITQVKKSHFYYKDGEREKFIPNHRVIEISRNGEVKWMRK